MTRDTRQLEATLNGPNKCMELALEGERKCRGGETKTGVGFLEAALAAGTDDLRTLSAIYSQLGNAYFYLGDYIKALEYHRHDLTLARTIGDKLGEAKASGNLGNTLKVLGSFDQAIVCCQRHLELSVQLGDKVGEGRALYNLGNVYHAKGKHAGRMSSAGGGGDGGGGGMQSASSTSLDADFPPEVRQSLRRAVEFYEANLAVVDELGDRAAKGRACGNLGNTFYLLGQFDRAVEFHLQRLKIAKEFGDKPAMRRAYSNLGNAHVFLGEFEKAGEYFRKALALAVEADDQATEAQACYSLGNTCTLMGEHSLAVEYHQRHLRIARRLKDHVGEARACWSLGNAYTALADRPKALYFAMLHYRLSREIGDRNGESVAEQNLSDLERSMDGDDGRATTPDPSADPSPPVAIEELRRAANERAGARRQRRHSMERMDVWRMTPPNVPNSLELLEEKTDRRKSVRAEKPNTLQVEPVDVTSIRPQFVGNTPEDVFDEESFFELLTRVQGKRIDDQRCDARAIRADDKENRPRVRASDSLRPERSSSSSSRWSISQSAASFVAAGWRAALRGMSAAPRAASRKRRQQLRSVNCSPPPPPPPFDPQLTSTPALRHSALLALQPPPRPVAAAAAAVGRTVSAPPAVAAPLRPLPTLDQNPDEFLEMIAGIQGRRMDDQRAQLDFLPGLQHPAQILAPHLRLLKERRASEAAAAEPSAAEAARRPSRSANAATSAAAAASADGADAEAVIDDEFIDMLLKCQNTRIEDQRSELPSAPTMPDDDIFGLIMKMQRGRFDEQRASLGPSSNKAASGTTSKASSASVGRTKSASAKKSSSGGSTPNSSSTTDSTKQSHKRTASQKLKNR